MAWSNRWNQEWYTLQAELKIKTDLIRELVPRVNELSAQVHNLELRVKELEKLVPKKKEKKKKIGLVVTPHDQVIKPFSDFNRKRRRKA